MIVTDVLKSIGFDSAKHVEKVFRLDVLITGLEKVFNQQSTLIDVFSRVNSVVLKLFIERHMERNLYEESSAQVY